MLLVEYSSKISIEKRKAQSNWVFTTVLALSASPSLALSIVYPVGWFFVRGISEQFIQHELFSCPIFQRSSNAFRRCYGLQFLLG